MKKADIVSDIIAFESGELDAEKTVDFCRADKKRASLELAGNIKGALKTWII